MARTFSARGRPVSLTESSLFRSATPELSMTSVQKEIASSESAELKAGTGRPGLTRQRSLFRSSALELGAPGTWRA